MAPCQLKETFVYKMSEGVECNFSQAEVSHLSTDVSGRKGKKYFLAIFCSCIRKQLYYKKAVVKQLAGAPGSSQNKAVVSLLTAAVGSTHRYQLRFHLRVMKN
jgi:hypothetical protein